MAENFSGIPEPEKPHPDRPIDEQLLVRGALESRDLSARFSPAVRESYDWWMRFVLKPVLFITIVGLSWWWSVNVSKLVWASGKGWISLDKTVLIALVTTSVGNFIALIVIIAKHLFPERKPDAS